MEYGGTKYYTIKQIKKNGHVIGNLILIGKACGYIVQLHYFDRPGYVINEQFDSMGKAENFFRKTWEELKNEID